MSFSITWLFQFFRCKKMSFIFKVRKFVKNNNIEHNIEGHNQINYNEQRTN